MFTIKQLETAVDLLKQYQIKEPLAVLIDSKTAFKNCEKADNIFTIYGLRVYMSGCLPEGRYYVGAESEIKKMAEEMNKRYTVKNELEFF